MILQVNELYRGRRGGYNFFGRKTVTRQYQVISDTPQEDVQTVLDASPYTTGDIFVDAGTNIDNELILENIEAAQDDSNPFVWMLTLTYVPNATLPKMNTDLQVEVSFRSRSVPFQKAYDEGIFAMRVVDVVNSVFDPFDPPPMTEEKNVVYSIQKVYEPSFMSLNTLLDYNDSINADEWMGHAAKTAKMNIKLSRVRDGTAFFYKVNFEIEIRPDTWVRKIMNRGYRYRPDAFAAPVWARIPKMGDTVPKPVLLNADGTKRADNELPIYLNFNEYRQRSWNVLGITWTD